ncbi:MAG: hypothetical protein V4630_12185 [Pseudomonadota bacterium]
MLKSISTAFAWAGAWAATTATVWAGVITPPPPAADSDNGNEGILLLVLLGAVVFAVAKGKAKPVEEGAPEIVDAEDGAGTGKY